jgi:lipoprotein-anchoring transpeptidase ErfK/SrfK
MLRETLPSPVTWIRAALVAGLFGSLASCGTPQPDKPFAEPTTSAAPTAADPEASYSYWDDDPDAGRLRVTIDLSEQTAYFYRGDKKVGRSRVATGLPGHSTPRGSFTIIEKTRNKRSNLYGVIVDGDGDVLRSDADSRRHQVPAGARFEGASMPYWMRLTTGGVGMHHGPIPRPGSPASHGCIRMPKEMAAKLFSTAPLGTPVKIVD